MTLTDTQRAILIEASQRPDRLAPPPDRLPAGARQAVAKALLKQGLVRDEHAAAYHARDVWQIDGRTRLLRLTEQGLRAIGLDPEDSTAADDATRHHRPAPAEATPVAFTAPTGGEDAPEENVPAEDAEPAQVAPTPAPRASLRDAAAAVLAAWDEEANRETDMITALDGPMQVLRVALAGKPPRAAREHGAPRKPREGTKQEQVLAMLRRAEGATIAQIVEATGWQPHTVRGFFAGLKKRQGITVIAAERIRQVGPNKQGAKGSHSIYRIEE
jgi:DNA-binding MarR family transcriptional regulator